MEIDWEHFEKIIIRMGTILTAEPLPKAVKPAYRLSIDFGEYGIKNSSAQITALYSCKHLIGRQIAAVLNFPPKKIAGFYSECLVLGIYKENNEVVLLQPESTVPNGAAVG